MLEVDAWFQLVRSALLVFHCREWFLPRRNAVGLDLSWDQ